MFYYRVTETRSYRKRGGAERQTVRRTYVREYMKPTQVGEFVASLLGAGRGAKRVTVEPINQAAFVRATRPGA